MQLTDLALRRAARIDGIDWAALPPGDARRLRELGFDDGVTVSVQHRGGWRGRGPLACRVGRMTIAIQRAHAAAIFVSTAGREPVSAA